MNTRTLNKSLVVVAFSSLLAFGQATDGNITGTVMDSTGAAIPGASVELENVATGVERTTETDATGAYRFNNVLIGKYRITVTAEGFQPTTLANVSVAMNRTVTANLTLELGEVLTQVEVVESAAQIDTTTATIGTAFASQQAIYNPAMNLALGVYNLSLLGAGVASSGGVGLGEGPSVGGQRPRNNNFTVEGVDNTRKDVTGRNVLVPNEAVAEFSMLQNQYSAEFGHSTGGQFNVAVKSGTNEYHGTAYIYHQNKNYNALDEADKRQGLTELPRFDSNRFGGSIGGPIAKNKLFFYGLYEYNPLGQASSPSSAILTPTAEGYQLLNQIAGDAGLSQTNLGVLQQFAAPAPRATDTTSVAGVAIPIGVLPIQFPNFQNNHNWVVSTDYNISNSDNLRFRYVENRVSGIDIDTSPDLPIFSNDRTTRSRLFAVSEFHNFSPSLLNEVRANYSYFNDSIPAGDFQFPGLDAFPNITIEQDLNLQLGPFDNAPQGGSINTYQLVDNITWIKGSHSIKGGIDVRRYIAPTTFIQRQRGDYNYSTLEVYLQDRQPDLQAQRNVGGRPYWGNSWNLYWFIHDEWKIKRNLTLTLGLRHEWRGVPADDRLQALNSVSSVPGVLEFNEPKSQTANFAPRVGLSFSPGTSGKIVFRAGFGMSYDNYFDNLGTLAKPPQLESTVLLPQDPDRRNFLAEGGILPTAPSSADLSPEEWRAQTGTVIFDQDLPRSYQWTFGIERVIANDYTFNIRYLGNRGSRLFTQSMINLRPIVTADRHLPTYLDQPSPAELDSLDLSLEQLNAQFGEGLSVFGVPGPHDPGNDFWMPEFRQAGFTNIIFGFPNRGNSTYHGMATELTRRFSDGLLFKAAYTWSKTIDDSTADLFSTLLSPRRPQNFQNMQPERSRSFLDRTHRFTFTWVYETPWLQRHGNWGLRNLIGNWVLSGTYTYESPQWMTPQSGLDSNLNIDSAPDRVIINPSGNADRGSDVSPLLNSMGETVAYLADNPNARFIKAGAGAYANGGRQLLPSDNINNWDLAVTKQFDVTESKRLEFQASFFNLFNTPQYVPGDVNTVRSVDSTLTRNHLIPGNPLFNDPSRVFPSHSRNIHFVARFRF